MILQPFVNSVNIFFCFADTPIFALKQGFLSLFGKNVMNKSKINPAKSE